MRVLKASDVAVDDLAFSPDGRAIAAYVKRRGVFLWNLEADPLSRIHIPGVTSEYEGGLAFSADGRLLSWSFQGNRRVYDRDAWKTTSEATFATHRRNQGFAQTVDGRCGISLHGWPDNVLIGWGLADDMWVQRWKHSTAELQVESLTLSADGQHFAMLTRDALGKDWQSNPRKVEVHDARTGVLQSKGEYPHKYADRLLFSPDSSQLVGFNAMNLMVWPIPEDGRVLGTPRIVRNTTRKHFTAMAYHPSGKSLYVTSNGEDSEESKDATVHVFDACNWTRTEQFTWKLGNMKAVAVSPDGTLAAAGGERGDIVIWDVDS